ncbi:glycosyltransferase family 2 protein [Serratia inhibens]|uniref:Glycosyltransferase family 2 protein n=1 Tax=Serratia inhibens TaxID=2338073 RepID=A0AA92X9C0_9GAMM|nr:glycosyltransferase family 2 protein [Serratia inhibens]RJF58402.1 glycosyltransferase family 2 protein [Serratia inhibens]
MIGEKLIDIIVPVYNQVEVIHDFLKSASDIDEGLVNVILVNDGSTDGTELEITKYISDYKKNNFHLINKCNGGVSSARNTGIKNTNSQYIWFCDPDDIIKSDLNDVFSILKSEPTTDVFVFSYETHYVNTGKIRVNDRRHEILSGGDFLLMHNNLSNSYWYPASDGTLWDKIYKRDSILGLLFDEGMICSEDFNFNFNVFKRVSRVMILKNILYKYNVYAGGTLSSTFNEKIFSDRVSAERETIIFLKEKKVSVRNEVKKHILKNIHLLSLHSNKNLLDFYESEHSYFCEKIYPFSSYREITFFILSKFNIYVFSLNVYRFLKKNINR